MSGHADTLMMGRWTERAEGLRGSGQSSYLGSSFAVARLVAVPWRAYREIADPMLREAILDFFWDTATGGNAQSAGTASRLASIVSSLEEHEPDRGRRTRIREIAARLWQAAPQGGSIPF